jgi:hypothetical protein
MIHHGLGILRGIEDEVTAAVGARRMAALRETLADLVPALEVLHSRETAGDE